MRADNELQGTKVELTYLFIFFIYSSLHILPFPYGSPAPGLDLGRTVKHPILLRDSKSDRLTDTLGLIRYLEPHCTAIPSSPLVRITAGKTMKHEKKKRGGTIAKFKQESSDNMRGCGGKHGDRYWKSEKWTGKDSSWD